MVCNYCGQVIKPGIAFCGNCGKAVAPTTAAPEQEIQIYCAVCNAPVTPGTFCGSCGTKAAAIVKKPAGVSPLQQPTFRMAHDPSYVPPVSPISETRASYDAPEPTYTESYSPREEGYEDGYEEGYEEYEDTYEDTEAYAPPRAYSAKPSKRKYTGWIIAIVSVFVLIGIIIGVIVWLENAKDENSVPSSAPTAVVQTTPLPGTTPTPGVTPTSGATPVPTPIPVQTPTPTPVSAAARVRSYSSELTYSRMEDIHFSTETDDATFKLLQNEIVLFDNLCADYMNGLTSAPPPHLRPGTDAYRSQTQYKQENPTLKQYYESISVQDARTDGTNYYVWAKETICSVVDGAEKTVTHHWVYRLVYEHSQWYVEDFTKDPAYK